MMRTINGRTELIGFCSVHSVREARVTDMPIAMMWGMGVIWLLILILLVLGIAALIKYLRS